MRITNNIMVNTSLSNLQKSLTLLNKYDTQVQTGKKITTASENPVIASKSLRYSTRLYEIDQYKSNVDEANSWLSSTETTLSSTYSILKKMRELVEDCANETIQDSDRKQSLIELKELRKQIAQEANTNVAGRYLFSGFKTDTPVMFTEETKVTYNLKETIEYTNSTKLNASEDGTVKAYSLKLLYGNIAEGAVKLKIGENEYPSENNTDIYNLEYVNQSDENAYNVPNTYINDDGKNVHTIRIIKDTGEIVFNESDYENLNTNIETEYIKSRFEIGDLNPVHYLKSSEKVDLSNPNLGRLENNKITLDAVKGIEEGTVKGLRIGGNEIIDDEGNINTNYEVVYKKSTDKSELNPNEVRICTDTGEIIFSSNFDNEAGIVSVNEYYRKETNPGKTENTTEIIYKNNLAGSLNNDNEIVLTNKGTIDENSISNISIKKYDTQTNSYVDIPVGNIIYTTVDNQIVPNNDEVVVYMDTNTMVAGNNFSQGCEVYIESLFITENTYVNEEIKYEVNSNSTIVVNTLAQDVFTSNMIKDLDLLINRIENFSRDEVTEFLGAGLTEIDIHLEAVLKENSTVGSKMNRLELIETRLADDKINFKDLKSENEDVDVTEAATNLAIQEMVYNAALSATSKVLQSSLLDFLQ